MDAKYSAIVSGKQNNSGIRGDLGYLLSRIQSIHPGHGEIKNDALGFKLANEFNGSVAVFRFTTHVPVGVLFEV